MNTGILRAFGLDEEDEEEKKKKRHAQASQEAHNNLAQKQTQQSNNTSAYNTLANASSSKSFDEANSELGVAKASAAVTKTKQQQATENLINDLKMQRDTLSLNASKLLNSGASMLASAREAAATQPLYTINETTAEHILDYSRGDKSINSSVAFWRLKNSDEAKTIPQIAVIVDELEKGTYKGTAQDIVNAYNAAKQTRYNQWYEQNIAPIDYQTQKKREEFTQNYGQDMANVADVATSAGTAIAKYSLAGAAGLSRFGAGALAAAGGNAQKQAQELKSFETDLDQVARDNGVDMGIGGLYAVMIGKTFNALNKGLGSVLPGLGNNGTAPVNVISKASILLKNTLAGMGAAYTTYGTTGTLRNIYNASQGRKITEQEAKNPWWSEDALKATLIAGALYAASGTASDLKKVEAINELAKGQGDLNYSLDNLQRNFQVQVNNGQANGAYKTYEEGANAIKTFFKNNYVGKATDTLEKFYLTKWRAATYGLEDNALIPTSGGSNVNTGVGPVMPTQGAPTQTAATQQSGMTMVQTTTPAQALPQATTQTQTATTSEAENLTEESLSKPIDRQLGDRLPSFKKAYVEDLPLSKKTQKEIYTSVYNETLNRIYNQTSKSPDVLEAHDYWNTAIKTIPSGLSDVANGELNNYISTDVPYFEHSEKFLEGWETLVWRAVANAYKEFANENGLDVADDINLDNPYTVKGTDIYGNKITKQQQEIPTELLAEAKASDTIQPSTETKPLEKQTSDRLPSFKKAYVDNLPISKPVQKEIYIKVYNDVLNQMFNNRDNLDALDPHTYWNRAITTIPSGLSKEAEIALEPYTPTDVPYNELGEGFREGWETLVWRAVANAYSEYAKENGLDIANDINFDNPYTVKGTDIYGNKVGVSSPKATIGNNVSSLGDNSNAITLSENSVNSLEKIERNSELYWKLRDFIDMEAEREKDYSLVVPNYEKGEERLYELRRRNFNYKTLKTSYKPVNYIFRAVSPDELKYIFRTGNIKSNQSMNIGYEVGEGLTVFKDRFPGFYLPDDGGFIIKIAVKSENGLFVDQDEYIKTPNKIPSSQIEAIYTGNGVLRREENGEYRFENYSQVDSKEEKVKSPEESSILMPKNLPEELPAEKRRFLKEFKQVGYININGVKINSVEDLADVCQVFRDPIAETLRVMYKKNGIVVGQGDYTTHSARRVGIDGYMLAGVIKIKAPMFGADEVDIMHNHPDSSVVASDGDKDFTKDLVSGLQGSKIRFGHHIIIDHNEFSEVFADGTVKEHIKLREPTYNEIEKDFSKEGWADIKANTNEKIAALASYVKNGKNLSAVLWVTNHNDVQLMQSLPNDFFNNSRSKVTKYIKDNALKMGATKAYYATTDPALFDKILKLRLSSSAIVLYEPQKDGSIKVLDARRVGNHMLFADKKSGAQNVAPDPGEQLNGPKTSLEEIKKQFAPKEEPKNEKPKGLRKKEATDGRKYLEGLTDEQIAKLEEKVKGNEYMARTGRSFELDDLLSDNKYLDMSIQDIRNEETQLREKERYSFNYNMEYRNAHPEEWRDLEKEIAKAYLASSIIVELWKNQTPNWRDGSAHIPENASIKSLTSGKQNKFTSKKETKSEPPKKLELSKKEQPPKAEKKQPTKRLEKKQPEPDKRLGFDGVDKEKEALEQAANKLRDELAKQKKDYEDKLAKKDRELQDYKNKTKERNEKRKVKLQKKEKRESEERRFKSATPKGKLKMLGRKIEKQTGYYEINNFPELDEVYEREFGKTIRQTLKTLHNKEVFPYLPKPIQEIVNKFASETYLKANWKTFDKYLREALEADELRQLIENTDAPVANRLLELIKDHEAAPITIKTAKEMYDDLQILSGIVDVAEERMSYKRRNEEIDKTLTKAKGELEELEKWREPKKKTDASAVRGKIVDGLNKAMELPKYLKTEIQSIMGGNPDSALNIIWKWFDEGNEKFNELEAKYARNFDEFVEPAPGGFKYVPDLEKALNPKAKPIDTDIKGSKPNGEKYEENLKLTKPYIMHIVASSRNEDNLMGFSKILLGKDENGKPVYSEPGGYIVPDEYWLKRGDIEKAYLEGKKYVFTSDDIKHLESLLTPVEKDFVNACLKVGKITAEEGNKVSQKLIGRDIFTVDNYVRIIRDKSTFDGELIDPAKLENLSNALSEKYVGLEGIFGRGGSLEARNHRSRRAIYGEPLKQAVENSFNGAKKYIAYALPLYDTDMLLNSRYPDTFEKIKTVDKDPTNKKGLGYYYIKVDELPENGAEHALYVVDNGDGYDIYKRKEQGKRIEDMIKSAGGESFFKYYNQFVDRILGKSKKTYFLPLASLRAKVVLNANLSVAAKQFGSYFMIGQFLNHPTKSMLTGLLDVGGIYKLAKDYLEKEGKDLSGLKGQEIVNQMLEKVTFMNTQRGLGKFSHDVNYIEPGNTILGRVNSGRLISLVDKLTVDATFRVLIKDILADGYEFGTDEFFKQLKQRVYTVYQSNPQYSSIYKTPLQNDPGSLLSSLAQFNTVMIMGYNNLAQAGMARAYYKATGDNANYKKANQRFRRSVDGIILGSMYAAAMGMLMYALMGKKEDKKTPLSQFLLNTANNMLSYTIIGDEIISALANYNNYDLTTNELSWANNFLDTLEYLGKAITEGAPSDWIKVIKTGLSTIGVPTNGVDNIMGIIGNMTNSGLYKKYAVLKDKNTYKQYLKNEEAIDGDFATFYDMKQVMTEKSLTDNYGYIKGSKAGTYSSKASAKSRAIRDVLGYSQTKPLNKAQEKEYNKWYEVFKNS